MPVCDGVRRRSSATGCERAAEVVERTRRGSPGAPDELTSSVVLTALTPAPNVVVRGCWSGDLDEGRGLRRPLASGECPLTSTCGWRCPSPSATAVGRDAAAAEAAVVTGRRARPTSMPEPRALAHRGGVPRRRRTGGAGSAEVRHAGGAYHDGGPWAGSTMGNRGLPVPPAAKLGRRRPSSRSEEPRRPGAPARLLPPAPPTSNLLEGDERPRWGAHRSTPSISP